MIVSLSPRIEGGGGLEWESFRSFCIHPLGIIISESSLFPLFAHFHKRDTIDNIHSGRAILLQQTIQGSGLVNPRVPND